MCWLCSLLINKYVGEIRTRLLQGKKERKNRMKEKRKQTSLFTNDCLHDCVRWIANELTKRVMHFSKQKIIHLFT